MKYFTRKVVIGWCLFLGIFLVRPYLEKNMSVTVKVNQATSPNIVTGAAITGTSIIIDNVGIPVAPVMPKVAEEVVKKSVKKKPEKTFLYATGYVKVRKKSSKKSPEQLLLKPEQKVQVIENVKNWAKIRKGNKTGYVLKKFLSKTKKKAKKLVAKKATNFRLTGYCKCYQCSEGWGTTTLSGRKARPHHTIAADLSVLALYTEVYIEGMGKYTVEDKGGGIRGKHIDVFCKTHSQCFGVKKYAKVYEIVG